MIYSSENLRIWLMNRKGYESFSEIDLKVKHSEGFHVMLVKDIHLGRSLIATKDFTVGEIVLKERQLISWRAADHIDFLNAYISADVETQALINDLYHPPIPVEGDLELGESEKGGGTESTNKLELMILAKEVTDSNLFPSLNLHHIWKLLLIWNCNAHTFHGTRITLSPLQEERVALFYAASMMNHSCLPNVSYTSKSSDDGCLMYIANRSIRKGETLSFSYIACFEKNKIDRMIQLRKEKYFDCLCPRCSRNFDDANGVNCLSFSPFHCPGVCYEYFVGNSMDGVSSFWHCNTCGIRHSPSSKRVGEVIQIMEDAKLTLQEFRGADKSNISVQNFIQKYVKIQKLFPHTNSILIQFRKCLSDIFSLHSQLLEASGLRDMKSSSMFNDGNERLREILGHSYTIEELISKETQCRKEILSALECLSSGFDVCMSGRCSCNFQASVFPPAMEGTSFALFIMQDALKSYYESIDEDAADDIEDEALSFAIRYVDHFQALFGDKDEDVQMIQNFIEIFEVDEVAETNLER